MATAPIAVPDRAAIGEAARRAIEVCRELATLTEVPGETTRRFLSPPTHDVHARLGDWMRRLHMDVRVDAAGTLHGVCPGALPAAPRLYIGSHLDTVPRAGAFDGILGVVIGIALAELLDGQRLPFAVEVLGFSEEEGVRFGVPFIGSRAFVGTADALLLAKRDAQDMTVHDAIAAFGLNPAELGGARHAGDALGYVEFHIEQGPVLDTAGESVAVVTDIVGQSRLDVTFVGAANHAGTTPMPLRRDALAGAAEWVLACEQIARAREGLVVTVGRLEASPGATNVIAGRCSATLDVRHADDGVRRQAVSDCVTAARAIAGRRTLDVEADTRLDQPATHLDEPLTETLAQAVTSARLPLRRMASGAGHDAMIVASHMPAAMLFLRSPGGMSLVPVETVREQDVADALTVGLLALRQLAGVRA